LALWRRTPTSSATNKEGRDKNGTQGDSTSRNEWFRTSRKITFAILYDKKVSVQQTKRGEGFTLLVSCRKFDDKNLTV